MPATHHGRGQHHHHAGHEHSHAGSHHHHAGHDGAGHDAAMREALQKYPFLWGAQEQYVPIASIPVTMGQKAPTVRIPKNGFLLELLFRFVGNANVTTAGTAGTPSILDIINSYILSYNGGFQFRSLGGSEMYVMDLIRNQGVDVVQGGPNWKNYAPATAGPANAIGFCMRDYIGLNTGVNADKYLLAAHARNADITMDITFNPNPSGTFAFRGVGANTEVAQITGTLFVEGRYLLDPASYARFDKPNLRRVQQIEQDTSYTQLVIGDNTVSVVPLNGPRYLQLAFRCAFNGVGDTQGISSQVSRIQLKINNGLNRYDISSQALAQRNCNDLHRLQCGPLAAPINAALPPGWYYLDFLSDASINNAVSQVGRNVISTERIASLWLVVTVQNGTNLSGNNMIELIKRVELPAVGGTNKLISPSMEAAA
jgi:hypothetical protein